MEVVLAPLVQVVASVAISMVAGLAVQAWRWFSTEIHGSKVELVVNAVQRAAGEVLDQLSTVQGGPEALEAAKERAISYAVENVMAVRLPDTVKALGVKPETVAGMIRGELNKLLVQAGAVPAPLVQPQARTP